MYDAFLTEADSLKVIIMEARTPSELMGADMKFNKFILAYTGMGDEVGEFHNLYENTVSYLAQLFEARRSSR